MNKYSFVSTFSKNFLKNIGYEPSGEVLKYIRDKVKETPFHTKIDSMGRHSEYHTFSLYDKLVTVVVDADTKKIITAIIETHKRGWGNYEN